jgi:hypothetical protein
VGCRARGGFIASHVVRYLDRFGTCGDPNLGFALLRCGCGLAQVVLGAQRFVLSESIERWLDRQGFGHDAPGGTLLAAAVAGRVAHGKRAGAKVRRMRQAPTRPFRPPPRCGESGGYNLHAGVVLHAVVVAPATSDVRASLRRSGVLAANAAARGPPGGAVALGCFADPPETGRFWA